LPSVRGAGRVSPPVVHIEHRWPGAPLQLIAWLTWPNDEDGRAKSLSALAHQQFAAFMRNHTAQFARAGAKALLEEDLIGRTGGWIYPELPAWSDERDRIGRELRKAMVVGHLLCLIRTIQSHHPDLRPSLNVAAWILDRLQDRKVHEAPANPKAQWAERKSVAPLCTAYLLARAEARHDGKDPWHHLAEAATVAKLLGQAQWLRRWASGHLVPGSRGVLLPDTEAAEYVTDLPEIEPRFGPLSPIELEVARSYQAPSDAAPAKKRRSADPYS